MPSPPERPQPASPLAADACFVLVLVFRGPSRDRGGEAPSYKTTDGQDDGADMRATCARWPKRCSSRWGSGGYTNADAGAGPG